jgi:2-polyprenyl-3-methyl-5-hydroxy-6-metoxy-1,4-benzoquinol methylase
MSSTSPTPDSGNPNPPRAQESEWYDQHYSTRDTAIGAAYGSEKELIQHLGPWYTYALPELRKVITQQTKLLELGCGSGRLPAQLVAEGLLPAENITGLDQSKVAVENASKALPKAHFFPGDIYDLKLPRDTFHVATLMEVIEHLEEPDQALAQIYSVIAPGGYFLVSFPNFFHLPWLVVRILAEKLNHPNWVVLQPIDKIYTTSAVKRIVERSGFKLIRGTGSNYGPPLLDRLERPWMTKLLNRLGLWWLSFHPIMVFQKPANP